MSTIIPLKPCVKCGESKPLTAEYWHRDKNKSDGFRVKCKVCVSAYMKTYHERYEDEIRKRRKEYRERNPEKIKQRKHDYHARNAERLRLEAREYRIENRERLIEYDRKRYSQRRLANLEVMRERRRRSYHRRVQREGHGFVRDRNRQRRAIKKLNGGSHTLEQTKELYIEQEGRCGYCGISLHDEYHEDHMRPLSRGGSNDIENIVLTCDTCNLSKHDKTPEEWKAVRGW